jgi:integrase
MKRQADHERSPHEHISPMHPSPQSGEQPNGRHAALQWQQQALSFTTLAHAVPLLPFQFPSLQHLDVRYEAACVHAKTVDGLADSSIGTYKASYHVFRKFLTETKAEWAFLGGHVQTQVQVLEAWIAWLRARGASHTTVNSYWRGLHAPLARIARQDNVADPTRFVAIPRASRRIPRFLTRDALETVFAFVRNYQWPGGRFEAVRDLSVLACMALAGLRLGEVVRLRVADVDLIEQTLRIERGKGRNGGKDRTAYMTDALCAAMTAYLELRSKRDTAVSDLFLSVSQDKPMARITVRRICDVVRYKTGIRFTPHMLRHTCATLLRQAGVPDRLAMEQLGHSSLGVLQLYSHVANGELRTAMHGVDVDFGGPTTRHKNVI